MDKRTRTGREITADRKRRAAAAAIVKVMFTDCREREVARLVQELPDNIHSGGYCAKAVEDLIVTKLAAIGLQ